METENSSTTPSRIGTTEDFNKPRSYVSPSVVTVSTYTKTTYSLTFSTGFIIYSDPMHTLICVNSSVLLNEDRMYVHFHDGSCEKAKVFLKGALSSGHVILVVSDGKAHDSVSFSNSSMRGRGTVFVAAEAEAYRGFNLMRGSIINPTCIPVGEAMRHGYKDVFSFRCPAVGRITKDWKEHGRQIRGAVVFNWDADVIGYVQALDEEAYDLKFGFYTLEWMNELEKDIQAINSKFCIKRGGESQHLTVQHSCGQVELLCLGVNFLDSTCKENCIIKMRWLFYTGLYASYKL